MITQRRDLEALDCAGKTSRGARGESRERFLIGHLNRTLLVSESNTLLGSRSRLSGGSIAHVLLVADGQGEAASGEAAAEAAADALAQQLVQDLPTFYGLDCDFTEHLQRELGAAIARCHSSVVDVERRAAQPSTGSTLTAAYVLWPRMHLVHLGDSRCYLIRDGALHRLTSDHVREPDARSGGSARRGVLTNALGAGIASPTPEFRRVDLRPGDAVVLCTGGLARRVAEREILETVLDAPSAERAGEELVRRAGSDDDATAVVARFCPAPLASAATTYTS